MQATRGASLNPSDQSRSGQKSRPPRRYILIFASIASVAYVIDVVTKVIVVEKLSGRSPVELVGHYFSLYLARNAGAAFSTGTSYTLVLSLIAVAAACAVGWYSRRLASTGWSIGLGFLLAGIVGNLTDRVFREPGFLRGHVVDFFMFPHFPIFNVADICINIAAAFIIIQAVRGVGIDGAHHYDRADDPDESSKEASES
jgi:signal peptidase II